MVELWTKYMAISCQSDNIYICIHKNLMNWTNWVWVWHLTGRHFLILAFFQPYACLWNRLFNVTMDVDGFSTIPAQVSPFETNIPNIAWNQLSRLSPANVIQMCLGWFSLEMEDNVCTIIFLWLKCLVDETMKHWTTTENYFNGRFKITFCGSSVSAE